jgi:glycosyltransferase involved in cell wall biosynthesis
MRRGHDVTLVPVYTPTRTDEPNMSSDRVLFGGISVYLQQYVPLFRKTPRFIDRILDSPRVINAFAGRAVSNDPRMLGDLTISMLQGKSGVLRKEFDKLIGWLRNEPPPDVINLPNSLLIALAAPLREAFGRPVFCTLQGEELFINGLISPYREQALDLIRRQTGAVDRFIAVSDYCAEFMSGFLEIPREKVAVVPLGINMSGYERTDPAAVGDGVFRVGYFARIAPEKGLHLLADAYVRFREKTAGSAACLDIAGYAAPGHRTYLNDARRKLEQAGLGAEFNYRGVLDRAQKIAFLRTLDLLSVPATYDEPKGLFLIEAMACGVPVVQPRRGAFPEIVEKTGGGLLVEPDDADGLADAFHALWSDRAEKTAMADRAFSGARAHYCVAYSAERMVDVCENSAAARGAL